MFAPLILQLLRIAWAVRIWYVCGPKITTWHYAWIMNISHKSIQQSSFPGVDGHVSCWLLKLLKVSGPCFTVTFTHHLTSALSGQYWLHNQDTESKEWCPQRSPLVSLAKGCIPQSPSLYELAQARLYNGSLRGKVGLTGEVKGFSPKSDERLPKRLVRCNET